MIELLLEALSLPGPESCADRMQCSRMLEEIQYIESSMPLAEVRKLKRGLYSIIQGIALPRHGEVSDTQQLGKWLSSAGNRQTLGDETRLEAGR